MHPVKLPENFFEPSVEAVVTEDADGFQDTQRLILPDVHLLELLLEHGRGLLVKDQTAPVDPGSIGLRQTKTEVFRGSFICLQSDALRKTEVSHHHRKRKVGPVLALRRIPIQHSRFQPLFHDVSVLQAQEPIEAAIEANAVLQLPVVLGHLPVDAHFGVRLRFEVIRLLEVLADE